MGARELESAPRWQIVLAFAAVYLIWGSTYLSIRFAIETLPPFLMAGVRFVTAGALLYGWAWWYGDLTADATGGNDSVGGVHPVSRHAQWAGAFAAGVLLLVGGNGVVVWAEQRVASGLAALLVSTVPLWVVVLEWLGPRSIRTGRPGRALVVGVLAGLGGVALLIGPTHLAESRVDLVGGLALVGASLSWALGSLLSRRLPLPASPRLATAMEMLAGGVSLLVVGILCGETGRLALDQVSAKSLVALGYLIAVGALLGFTAYVWLLRVVPTAKVATYAYVNPVVALALGWALAGEELSGRTLMAAAVILAAVVLITTFRASADRLPEPAEEPTTHAALKPSADPPDPYRLDTPIETATETPALSQRPC